MNMHSPPAATRGSAGSEHGAFLARQPADLSDNDKG